MQMGSGPFPPRPERCTRTCSTSSPRPRGAASAGVSRPCSQTHGTRARPPPPRAAAALASGSAPGLSRAGPPRPSGPPATPWRPQLRRAAVPSPLPCAPGRADPAPCPTPRPQGPRGRSPPGPLSAAGASTGGSPRVSSPGRWEAPSGVA